jgi:antitoxin ParD1/3/4
MSTVEKVSISLTEDMLAQVKAAVASGRYASASEVIREALREWAEQEQRRELKRAELRRLIQEGLDSGSKPYDGFESARQNGRRRLAALQAKAG